ncbi:MAG: hypothetical protein KDA36_05310 [Planctomycetaceae bacterium]|nr:hypothetical protein [Planctomycetaceae bacterium]
MLEYLVLRVCERLRMREGEFWEAGYETQVRWLGYELQREREEFELMRPGESR